jgi:hypothetical protein
MENNTERDYTPLVVGGASAGTGLIAGSMLAKKYAKPTQIIQNTPKNSNLRNGLIAGGTTLAALGAQGLGKQVSNSLHPAITDNLPEITDNWPEIAEALRYPTKDLEAYGNDTLTALKDTSDFLPHLDMQGMADEMHLQTANPEVRRRVLKDIAKLDGLSRIKQLTDNLTSPIESGVSNTIYENKIIPGRYSFDAMGYSKELPGQTEVPSPQIKPFENIVASSDYHNHPRSNYYRDVAPPSGADVIAAAWRNTYLSPNVDKYVMGRTFDGKLKGYQYDFNGPFDQALESLKPNSVASTENPNVIIKPFAYMLNTIRFMAEPDNTRNHNLRNAALIGGVAALPTAGLLATRGLLNTAPTALAETAGTAAGHAISVPLAAAATTAGTALTTGLLSRLNKHAPPLDAFSIGTPNSAATFLDQPILTT